MPARRKKPLVIGLTGSIGMGKSATARMFAGLGIPVYDADEAVHMLYAKGGAAVPAIAKAFPEAVRNGEVVRDVLAERVAGDKAAFAKLESIVHPLVAKMRDEFLAKARGERAELAVLDVPLLFESGGEKDVDAIVVVSAPEKVQSARVLARPGMTRERLMVIRARQVPDAEKRAKADFVIDTGKGLGHAKAQVEAIVAALKRQQS